MPRWTYIVPRLIILLLIALAVFVGADPISRALVVNRLQDSTGAKVEVGQLRWDLNNQNLFIQDIALADPRSPMTNLAQANLVYLQIDPEGLPHRQFVVEHGQTSRLIFGTPRTSPGTLEAATPTEPRQPFKPHNVAQRKFQSISQRWLDHLTLPSAAKDVENPHLFQAAQKLQQKWAPTVAQYSQQVNLIDKRTRQANDDVKSFQINDLRMQNNPYVSLESVAQDTRTLTEGLQQLQSQFEQDLNLLDQAALKDSQSIESSVSVTRFDSDDVSQLLLAQTHAQYVDQVMNLLRWFEHVTPEPQVAFRSHSQRGVDVDLPGVARRPGFLIKALELNGEGQLLGQHFEFAGMAYDLTNRPDRLDRPSRFELRAQGNQHVIVSCLLDRRDPEAPVDRLKITCPELTLADQVLGEEKSLQLTMGPEVNIQAEIDIEIANGQVSGTIEISHTNVALHVDHLAELAGGDHTQAQMNAGLNSISSFRSVIQVSGNVENYEHVASSDLGTKFASAVNQLLDNNRQRHIAQRKSLLQEALNKQRQMLDQQLAAQLRQLQAQLTQNSQRVANLRQQVPDSPIRR